MGARALVNEWGSSAAERGAAFPCDDFTSGPHRVLFRAVDVAAPAELVFRWLCQLRVAPYSYDWIDNRGKRSPSRLVAGLDDLEVGQRVMSIFRLVAFDAGRSITLDSTTTLFGRFVVTYLVVPVANMRSRLVVKLAVARRPGVAGWAASSILPLGDLIMMRKQLLSPRRARCRRARS